MDNKIIVTITIENGRPLIKKIYSSSVLLES